MNVFVKNNTGSDIELNDLSGYILPKDEIKNIGLDIPITEIMNSGHLIDLISSNQITINNGSKDLDRVAAVRYISLQSHLNPISLDGKEVVKAESRPPGMQTSFTMAGDNLKIGDGKELKWDFSNDDDLVPNDSTSLILFNNPLPIGYKRKVLKVRFNDYTYIKEGTLYHFNTPFGLFIDMSVVCPVNNYYKNRNGQIQLATNNVVVSHYVSKYFLYETCSCGHTLLAETCQELAIPPNYEVWAEITTPIDDVTSKGFGCFTLYRPRTALLPNEPIL